MNLRPPPRRLETELFTDDDQFKARHILSPDVHLKVLFQQELTEADRLADVALARNRQDATALFAKTLSDGLRADYAALMNGEMALP